MTNPKHTDTSRSGDLVERLRDLAGKFEGQGGKHYTAALFGECADRIEALEAEVERLRVIEADRAELVADVFAYLIARSQEPEEFLPGSYVKRLHADERTAWLKKMQEEYDERHP